MYKFLLKPVFFLFDAEKAHTMMFNLLGFLQQFGWFRWILYHLFWASDRRSYLGHIYFKNPVGLAAGMDKSALLLPTWDALGFGYVVVGTIVPEPQIGNPKPRLFRLPGHEALINRMGFNSLGLEVVLSNLRLWRKQYPKSSMKVGASIGFNKDMMSQFAKDGNLTPLIRALRDMILCLNPLTDFIEFNVSSPNTPGLRGLQEPEILKELLGAIEEFTEKPVFLKIAPDLLESEIRSVIDAAYGKISALVLCNTTTGRDLLLYREKNHNQIGGLSGEPINERMIEILKMSKKYIDESKDYRLPIIAVGGINSPKRAKIALRDGASMIQIYTGLVYEGPGLVKKIIKLLNKI